MISISYHDLVHTNAISTCKQAFGLDGLGILLITDLPSRTFVSEDRPRVLRLARSVAHMSDAEKAACSHPQSNHAIGYSCGQESMTKGKSDDAKCSFYSNPEHDVVTTDPTLKEQYPAIYGDNLWPSSLPSLRDAVRAAGAHQIEIGLLVAKQLDALMSDEYSIHDSNFESRLSSVKTRKSRLLHYKPSNTTEQRLCGWHLDHGSLTVLVAPMYLNQDGVASPIDDSGLLIKTRRGATVQVRIPVDGVAVQLGEVFQLLSGGRLRATPHCVCGTAAASAQHLSREQFVVFMDCHHETPLALPPNALSDALESPFLPIGVPSLRSRFENGMSYAEFSKRTYRAYATG